MSSKRQMLTTGEIARLCGFSSSAVLQWIRTGKLVSFSSPGGQHRVTPDALARFLRTHAMPFPPELAEHGRHRVLVVDDDEIVRDALACMLTSSGHDFVVATAANGIFGCMKIPEFKPHLVVLDVFMPDLDGVALCRSVRTNPATAGARILLVTGYPGHPRVTEALSAGANDVLSKPVRVPLFLDKVRSLLDLPPRHVAPVAAPAFAEMPVEV